MKDRSALIMSNHLFIDSRGDLWVGVDGALNRYDREQDRFNKLDFDGLLTRRAFTAYLKIISV